MEKGTIVRWDGDKGFGFIKPDQASAQEIFVHISAFKYKKKPNVGDKVVYLAELKDGRLKAIKANVGSETPTSKTSSTFSIIPIMIIIAVAMTGWTTVNKINSTETPQRYLQNYRCETGKYHCSQMKSCEEASFYISHCPNTQMDGDGDGVPCERQLCN